MVPGTQNPAEFNMFSANRLRETLRLLWIRRAHVVADICMLASAFTAAYLLRFEFSIPSLEYRNCIQQLPMVVGLQFTALLMAGVYMYIWRYIGLRDVMPFVQAACVPAVLVFIARLYLSNAYEHWRVPVSVIL